MIFLGLNLKPSYLVLSLFSLEPTDSGLNARTFLSIYYMEMEDIKSRHPSMSFHFFHRALTISLILDGFKSCPTQYVIVSSYLPTPPTLYTSPHNHVYGQQAI